MRTSFNLLLICVLFSTARFARYESAEKSEYDDANSRRLKEILNNPKSAKQSDIDFVLSSQTRSVSVRFLRKVGTEQAYEEMLKIALDPNEPKAAYAAGVYAESMNDKSKIRRLLKSNSPDVCDAGLRGLVGIGLTGPAIDTELFEDLHRLLSSSALQVRRSSALVIELDPSGQFGQEKAEILIKSMQDIEKVPGANNDIFALVNGADTRVTEAEVTFDYFINALGATKGLDLKRLQQLTPAAPGMVRDCVLIARARQKDDTVRSELHRIVRHCPSDLIRGKALTVFYVIGAFEDVDVLREVATKDSSVREPTPDELQNFRVRDVAAPKNVYPLRNRAEEIIKKILKN